MANRTDTQADTVHGTNPQYLVDRIIRSKIYNDAYWKEFCFGLTTESLIDKAAELDYIGGTYGGRRRPAKFLCLFLKMLQIQPDEDVILEYIKQSDLKYLRALGVAYYRISQRHVDVHKTLEPLYADYRKLRYRDLTGKMSIIHMDEFIDWLFREKTVCDVTMPGLPKRELLEATLDLPPRESVLEDDLADLDDLEPSGPPGADGPPSPSGPAGDITAAAGGVAPRQVTPQDSQERLDPSQSPHLRASGGREACTSSRRSSGDAGGSGRHGDDSDCGSGHVGRERSRRMSRSKEARHKKGKKDKKEKKHGKAPKKDDVKLDRETKKQKKDKDGLSVEEWNDIRKGMGLKPLKA